MVLIRSFWFPRPRDAITPLHDRVLTRDNPENTWYFRLMNSDQEYALHVDNDEVRGADNKITVFVNCKVKDSAGRVLGVVGVGIRIDSLPKLLKSYEEKYRVTASLISKSGGIEISTTHTGHEKGLVRDLAGGHRKKILSWNNDSSSLTLWTPTAPLSREKSFIVVRYIPELSWNLVVAQNTGLLISEMRAQLYQTCAILLFVIVVVLVIVTTVIRKFNKRITLLMEERQAFFSKATEQIYDNICEFNITRIANRHGPGNISKHSAPREAVLMIGQCIIAESRSKEFREGYLAIFDPRNVMREYAAGNNHLRYDFMISQDGTEYSWTRVDAHVFYSAEDKCIHMVTYRKNIDGEKEKNQAVTDEMTGFYTKRPRNGPSANCFSKSRTGYAFFIFDIDNFKQAIDRFGHAFEISASGPSAIIRRHFKARRVGTDRRGRACRLCPHSGQRVGGAQGGNAVGRALHRMPGRSAPLADDREHRRGSL